jgi:Rrf2 family iron-sulfur cluster assembly transcriptional regulator
MIFSKACEYGIKATVYIALKSMHNERASLKDIAAEIESPEAYTAKILQLLTKSNIIYSIKGAQGGFEIDLKNMNRLLLEDIVTAIDGGFNDKQCVLGLKACSQKNPCPVHDKYKFIKSNLRSMLENTSIYEMASSLHTGHTCLKTE